MQQFTTDIKWNFKSTALTYQTAYTISSQKY